MLFAVAIAGLLLATPAPAQTTAPDAPKKSSTTKKKKTKKKATPPPPKQDVDEETRKALEGMSATPAPAADAGTPATPAPAETGPAATAAQEPVDDDPPTLTHTPVKTAKKNKTLTLTAKASDPSGVFGPVLYIRKKGMSGTDYVALKMGASKTGTPGDYSVDVPAALISVDALEYYIEAWDNVGNGPARSGTPENPHQVKVEEEKKVIVAPPPKPKGGPPAITHSAVAQADKGKAIELNARLAGDTGVQGATVMFRHVGEKDYKALPMGNIGGNDYTATIPAGMATGDIEYYLEAFDQYGNGPGRSGAPNAPFVIKVSEPKPLVAAPPPVAPKPHMEKAPFKPNPGRAAGWLLMGTFVGGMIWAGGEAYASWQANNSYQHTFNYEGRLDPGMLSKANAYGNRAKTAGIVAGAALVGAIVLFVVFPEHPDTIMVGGGGDIGVRF